MAALILSSDTRDTSDGITIKVKANVIEVAGLRRKFNRNSKHTNLDFELVPEKPIDKKNLKMEAWFGTSKISATICSPQAVLSDVHTFASLRTSASDSARISFIYIYIYIYKLYLSLF
ncbi:putative ribosomal protein L6, alpha-beta [Rosa chinensis]|uniref:Putative ribosomal protein L6, alpha-beta n=1 Tax=Rosa chinensis TaxID=74649 RepID=A0A2P6P7D2_ROSCH|nr:putative ribosomal protein L6, alpha-beta [Rosa chinensis]